MQIRYIINYWNNELNSLTRYQVKSVGARSVDCVEFTESFVQCATGGKNDDTFCRIFIYQFTVGTR